MERREFLKAGAAGAAMAATGCATGKAKTPPSTAPVSSLPPGQIEYLTTGIDRVLASMEQANLVHDIVPAELPWSDDQAERARIESFLHKGIGSLYVSGVFLDQPDSVRAHPELQKRVVDNLPMMDEAIRESTDVLAGLTQIDGKQFQQVLHQHPEIGMRVAESLDRRADDLGISHKRRLQLRLAATQITARLRYQDPAVLAEEYLVKTNKAYVRHGASELARKLAANAGQQMFWAPVVAAEGGASGKIFRPSGPIVSPASQPPASPRAQVAPSAAIPSPEPKKTSAKAATAAGWMFGIGLGVFLGGLMFVEAGVFPGVFAMTAGVLLVLAALVTLIVASIMHAANR